LRRALRKTAKAGGAVGAAVGDAAIEVLSNLIP
jgi:hypothetical protein